MSGFRRMAGGLSCWMLSVLMGVPTLVADAPLEGTKPAQWRVVWTSDPAHQATIVWSTARPAGKYVVEYWAKTAPAEKSTVAAVSGRYIGGKPELYYYHAPLSELQPSTAYQFQVVSDGQRSPELYFVTAPIDDRPFSLFVGGDSRTDRNERRRVNQMLSALVTKSFANDDPADDLIALRTGGLHHQRHQS